MLGLYRWRSYNGYSWKTIQAILCCFYSLYFKTFHSRMKYSLLFSLIFVKYTSTIFIINIMEIKTVNRTKHIFNRYAVLIKLWKFNFYCIYMKRRRHKVLLTRTFPLFIFVVPYIFSDRAKTEKKMSRRKMEGKLKNRSSERINGVKIREMDR